MLENTFDGEKKKSNITEKSH